MDKKRQYRPVQLLQLPLAVIFGLFTDLSNGLLSSLLPGSYAEAWIYCITGILLVGAGVSAEVLSSTIPLAAEGLSLALTEAAGRKFGTMKVTVDCTLVAVSLILSILFLHSTGGVREGTVAAALLVGTCARFLNKLLQPIKEKWF